MFYVGLALFLTGSGLNVTCINMMLTQRFTPEDPRREGAFLWNYAGMNIGFFVGFTAAGHYQATESYSGCSSSRRSAISSQSSSPCLSGRRSPIATHRCSTRRESSSSCAARRHRHPHRPRPGRVVHAPATGQHGNDLKVICAAVALTLIYLTVAPDRRERRNMSAYLILTIGSLVFWSLYQMAPNGLQLFAVNNVNLVVGIVQIRAAVDSEHQHGLHRGRRPGVRGALYPAARTRVED